MTQEFSALGNNFLFLVEYRDIIDHLRKMFRPNK